jgi:hypothetical protein
MKTCVHKNSSTEVKRRIFKIIDSMPEIEMKNLLMGLEKWKQSKLNGRRKYLRKDTSIYAFFKNNGLSFREYVKNVSAGGLFIETSIPISVNNELFMQFFHPDSKKLIKVNGEIIRIDSNGIGVKFDKPQPHIV